MRGPRLRVSPSRSRPLVQSQCLAVPEFPAIAYKLEVASSSQAPTEKRRAARLFVDRARHHSGGRGARCARQGGNGPVCSFNRMRKTR